MTYSQPLTTLRQPSFLAAAGLTAIGYYLLGQLGLLLAIPPGFASIVWPAAGLALIASLRWGVAALFGIIVGSLSINVPITLDSLAQPSLGWSTLSAPLFIAFGSALQAYIAAQLCRASLSLPIKLNHDKDIAIFMLLAGPAACLLAATFGTFILLFNSLINTDNIVLTWLTWWVGDSIGVVIFGPIFLMLLSSNNDIPKRRRYIISTCMSLMFIVVTFLFITLRTSHDAQVRLQQRQVANTVVQEIDKQLNIYIEDLFGIRQFFRGSQRVDADEFTEFTGPALDRHKGLHALGFAPRITVENRQEWLNTIASTYSNFNIHTGPSTSTAVLRDNDEQYPVYYIEPYSRNQPAHGFDLASNVARYQTIKTAVRQQSYAISEPIRLVQEKAQSMGVLIFLPISQEPYPLGLSYLSAREYIMGIASSVIRVDDLISNAILNLPVLPQQLWIEDISTADTPSAKALFGKKRLESQTTLGKPIYQDMRQGNRIWRIHFYPDQTLSTPTWNLYTIMLFAFVVVVAVSMVLISITGKHALINDIVKQRTSELIEAKEKAERANIAKSNFLANISHDIRTPLNAIIGFTHRILNSEKALSERAKSGLETVEKNGKLLADVINNLLDLSSLEAGKLDINRGYFTLKELILDIHRRAITLSQDKDIEWQLTWQCDKNKEICSDQIRVRQVLDNLIDNAFKYTLQGRVHLIIDVDETKGFIHFTLTDTGIGISSLDQQRLFKKFERVKHIKEGVTGSGMGLALVKELLALLGGHIELNSRLGEGSTIKVQLPLFS